MASQTPAQKKGWGSLLSNAVAGLESRLDNILAEDAEASAKSRAADAARKDAVHQSALSPPPDASRESSRSRVNKRLEERLAKAVNKGTESRSTSRAPPVDRAATASPAPSDTARTSLDSKTSEVLVEVPQAAADATAETKEDPGGNEAKEPPKDTTQTKEALRLPTLDVTEPDAPSVRPSQESGRPSLDAPSQTSVTSEAPSAPITSRRSPEEYEAEILAQQSELHTHLERIDALQAKLSYLAKSAATSAKEVVDSAAAGSLEKKLAERDGQIAQLLEEGQKLSKTELKHSSAIKTLRTRLTEEQKSSEEVKKRLARAEQQATEAAERARQAESQAKQAQEGLKVVAKIEKDVEALSREKEAAGVLIADLRRQLSDATHRAQEAEKRAQSGALEKERKVVADLREELDNSKIEKKLMEDRSRKEVAEAREEAVRQREKANAAETEVSNLETKLEVLRARTEEVSSGATSGSQAKLLRQIETLQTQYALASENWQGIEGSLISRVSALEKERDEIAKRETDIRKKAREVNTKSRHLEEELEIVNDRARALETDVQEQRSQAQKLRSRLDQAESTLLDARAEFDRQKKLWDTDFQQRLEEEKTKWQLEVSSHPPSESYFRGDSPIMSYGNRKPSTPDLLGLHTRRNVSRNISMDHLSGITTDRSSGRIVRTSAKPPRSPVPEALMLQRQGSESSVHQLYGNGNHGAGASAAPSIHTIDNDDVDTATSSPHRTVADLVSSASTVGAGGPSAQVQLVERMSAAVRRLESEKAVSKEELQRLQAQRDEARDEVVSLMRETEEKRGLEAQVEKLEKELDGVSKRYQTTLEMLGERSEEVEELRQDVKDLKKIYRELVDSTMK